MIFTLKNMGRNDRKMSKRQNYKQKKLILLLFSGLLPLKSLFYWRILNISSNYRLMQPSKHVYWLSQFLWYWLASYSENWAMSLKLVRLWKTVNGTFVVHISYCLLVFCAYSRSIPCERYGQFFLNFLFLPQHSFIRGQFLQTLSLQRYCL